MRQKTAANFLERKRKNVCLMRQEMNQLNVVFEIDRYFGRKFVHFFKVVSSVIRVFIIVYLIEKKESLKQKMHLLKKTLVKKLFKLLQDLPQMHSLS